VFVGDYNPPEISWESLNAILAFSYNVLLRSQYSRLIQNYYTSGDYPLYAILQFSE